MDLRSGMPYHWIFNGLPFTYPRLEHDARCTEAFHELFPDLPFATEYQWCGTFGGIKDGPPISAATRSPVLGSCWA